MAPSALKPQDAARKPRSTSDLAAASTQEDDIFRYPAVKSYATAHPSEARTIPKFGSYLLLQTLEREDFYKVRLGVHAQTGEEVAVKTIQRKFLTDTTRRSNIAREVEVILSLKHPNIVCLYDVIESDEYLGIILQHPPRGELLDYILTHRPLREKEAARLFSQLISGVWYIHQKKIAHRDLKLENLLLDSNGNLVINDFYFANSFQRKSDDLMATRCGSPCYAAPELVVGQGRYSGKAADIWSCGVILYAMVAGILPFDDDPANPDGEDVNLLYKYIARTPLSFPDHTSADAKDLLKMMLVPDPTRRANIDTIITHRWLSAFAGIPRTDGRPSVFGNTVEDLEARAVLVHYYQHRPGYKRLADVVAASTSPKIPEQKARSSDGVSSPPGNKDKGKRNARILDHTTQVQYTDVPVISRSRSQDGRSRRKNKGASAAVASERAPTQPQVQTPSQRNTHTRPIRRSSNNIPSSPHPTSPVDSKKPKPPSKPPQPRGPASQDSTKRKPATAPVTPPSEVSQPHMPAVLAPVNSTEPQPATGPATPPNDDTQPRASAVPAPQSPTPIIVVNPPQVPDATNANGGRGHKRRTSSPGSSRFPVPKETAGKLGHTKGQSSIEKLTSVFLKVFNSKSRSANSESDVTASDDNHITRSLTGSNTRDAAYTKSRALIGSLTGNPATRAQLADLTGDDAQRVVDFLNQILDDDDGQIELNERKNLLSLLSKLARSAQVFPTSCQLDGVQCDLAKHHNFGGFGFIYKGMYRSHDICVKAVRLYSGGGNERSMKAHMKELVLWAHLSHKNIVPFYGVYTSDEPIPRVCIVSPWIRNGDLLAYLNLFPDSPRVLLISDIIDGIQYLHESKIIHSDLKASNVLVSDAHRAMVTDFGVSHVSMTILTTTQSPAGTANWMAPELFDEDDPPATEESDIWAFGCVCYEVFTEQKPFSQYRNTVQLINAVIRYQVVPVRPALEHGRKSEAEDRMWTMMEKCWNYDPKKRPKCQEIRQFIADLEVQDNRPPTDDGAAFLDVKRARLSTKINYKRVYEVLQRIEQGPVKGKDGKAKNKKRKQKRGGQ